MMNFNRQLDYDELETWFFKIINLEYIRGIGCVISIKNELDLYDVYGRCSNYGDIDINLKAQPNLEHLILTIAHEIAHLDEFNSEHSYRHERLTKEISNYIKKQIKCSVKKNTQVKVQQVKKKSNLDSIYNKLNGV